MNFNCPEEFTTEDMIEVARIRLPGISEKSIRLIVARAMQSEQLLHAMTAIATRAKWLAGKSGRTEPSQADIDRASNEFLKGVCASSETLEIPPSEDKAEKEGSRRPRPPRLAATGPPAIGAGRVTFEKSENVLA